MKGGENMEVVRQADDLEIVIGDDNSSGYCCNQSSGHCCNGGATKTNN